MAGRLARERVAVGSLGGEGRRVATAFARSIGAHADEIAVVPSASAGINAIATALHFSGPRRRVVMGDFEFPTMAQAWLAQERRGAAIAWARATGDNLPVEAYEAVVDETTLIVPATHVCFRNGHKTDIAALTRLCHARGAYVFLDDYQRTGSGPIDVHALGVDFMVTGCLKYLLSPAGVAFLYVRRDLIEQLEPAITGWFGRINPFAFRIDALDWPSSRTSIRERDAAGAERLRRPRGARAARRGRLRRDRFARRAAGDDVSRMGQRRRLRRPDAGST